MKQNYCIERKVSWDVPKGAQTGKLIEAGPYEQKDRFGLTRNVFRLVFEVDHDFSEYVELRAQKRYAMKPGFAEKVVKDLKRWLGEEFFNDNPDFKWEDLYGLPAKLQVTQLQSEEYAKPYSKVKAILPFTPKRKRRKSQDEIVLEPAFDQHRCVVLTE